jgi:hypothetical protein
MLTFQDCLELAAVTEEEVAAIARHERIPLMIALELGAHLMRSSEGMGELRELFVDTIREARARHDCDDCVQLGRVLDHFLATHPDCRAGDPERADELQPLTAVARLETLSRASGRELADADAIAEAVEDARRRGDCRMCAKLSQLLVQILARERRVA